MATPDIRSAYELLRRAMQQQGANAFRVPYSTSGYDPDGFGSQQGGLLGRLQELDAAQNSYQQPVEKDSDAQSMPEDPNFRQLVRVPSVSQTQDAVGASDSSADQPSPTYPNAVDDSAASPNTAADSVFDALSAFLGHQMASRKAWENVEKKLAKSNPGYLAQIKARARERGNFTPSDPGDSGRQHCDDQKEKELRQCYQWYPDLVHKDYYLGCKKTAIDRWATCNSTGEIPDTPAPWRPGTDLDPGDEETWRNYFR